MKTIVAALGFSLVVATVGTSCRRDAPVASITSTTGANLGNDTAVMQITSARCDRALACNNIGEDRKYADRSACSREVGEATHATLRGSECPQGVSEDRLANCIAEIRNEPCGNPNSAPDRFLSCRSEKLCVGREGRARLISQP